MKKRWRAWKRQIHYLTLEPLQIAAGLDAARQNLRLALELDKGDLPLSRAYWMLGGHLLAVGAYADAEAHFSRAAMYAIRAGEQAEGALAFAFGMLAYWLLDCGCEERQQSYEKARERLAVSENGQVLQEQLDDAKQVFMQQGGRDAAVV